MYYRLKDGYILRGWDRLPHALLMRPENTVAFLQPDESAALELCDGSVDCEIKLIPEQVRESITKLMERGIIEPCAHGEGLCDDQRYRKYDCRFIGAAHWSITGKCNYRCKHCYMSAPEAKLGELPHDATMEIIEQLAECGIMRVSLTGGEPLVRDDFEEIVAALSSKRIWITQIYTNGALVHSSLLTMLERYGFKPEFSMSYDGDGGWHDWLRGIPGAAEKVLTAFDLCHERGFRTSAEMCIHRGNKHLLGQSINTLAAHHCNACKASCVSDTGLWLKYGQDYTLGMDEFYQLALAYIPHFFKDGMPMAVMLGGLFLCEKGKTDWCVPAKRFDGSDSCLRQTVCGHARNMLYISPEGRMLPCLKFSSFDIQNKYPLIADVGLKNGLSESAYMELIDMRIEDFLALNTECGTCEHKYTCAGGCRAGALDFDEANIIGTDRASCAFFKGGYDAKIKSVAEKAVAALSRT